MSDLERMLTVKDLAECLQVSYKTALKVMKKRIPYIEVEGQYRMHPKHVDQFINSTVH